jgi:hypothetical protein
LLVFYNQRGISDYAVEGFQKTINLILSYSGNTFIRDSADERTPGSSLTGKQSLDKVYVTRVGLDWVMIHRIGGEITLMHKDDYEDSLNNLIIKEREDASTDKPDSINAPSNLQND